MLIKTEKLFQIFTKKIRKKVNLKNDEKKILQSMNRAPTSIIVSLTKRGQQGQGIKKARKKKRRNRKKKCRGINNLRRRYKKGRKRFLK